MQDFEFNLVFDDGTKRDVEGYGTPLWDEEGQPRGAVHILVDVTERKQNEEALREAYERSRHNLRSCRLVRRAFKRKTKSCKLRQKNSVKPMKLCMKARKSTGCFSQT